MLRLFCADPFEYRDPFVPRYQHRNALNEVADALNLVRDLMDVVPQAAMGAPRCGQNQQLAQNASNGTSEIINDDMKFQVMLDVHDFKPDELQVKLIGNRLKITGKHEERQDEHGFISREFTRTYLLPKNVDCASLTSNLGTDGKLSIEAQKKAIEKPEERTIAIEAKEKEENKEQQIAAKN